MFIATLDCYIAWSQFFPTARALIGNFQVSWNQTMKLSALHLVKISGIFGSAVNGTLFVCSSHCKIPRKSGKSKKVDPFTRLEFPNGMSCSIYVSRRLYQFQVHGQAQRRPGVYDQMEQLFTNRKLNLGFHRNFWFFNLMESAHCFPPKSLIGQHCKIYDRRYSEVYWVSSIKVSRALLGKRWHSWETKLTVSLRTTSHQRSNELKNWDIFFSRFTFTKH